MIIVERYYEVANPCGGRDCAIRTRKVFADDDIAGVQNFLNERSTV